jgi:hypothetical protein
VLAWLRFEEKMDLKSLKSAYRALKASTALQASLFLALTVATTTVPAQAFVGRLGAHSVSTIKHWQARQSGNRSTHHLRRHALSRLLRHSSKVAHLSRRNKGKVAVGSGRSYMWSAPELQTDDLSEATRDSLKTAFNRGAASQYSPADMVDSGVFVKCPMHGGVFKRRGNIKYIILHSTETARAADAQRVIRSWSNRGLRHPGAQFVVDRDGVVYCTADPAYGTSHVDEHRTKFGVNNDNSVGIEMVRTGDQDYTAEQMQSISCLVSYLQQRYSVDDAHIYGHGKVQPSDRSDPVNFNWQAFAADKDSLRGTAYNTALHIGM